MTSRLAVSVVAVCAGYYLTGLFALVFRFSQTGMAVMWPPTAVLLAALLLAPARLWWVYLLAILPTHAHLTSHFQPGVTPVVILIQYVGHVTQVLLAAIMLRRFGGGRPRFDNLEGMTRYIAIAAIAAPAVASVLAIVLFEQVGWVSGFWMPWRQRFFASVIPALTVTPLIVMAAQPGVARTVLTSASRRVEFALLLAALLAVGIPVLGISVATRMVMPGLLVYALLPLLLWAATRFGTGGLSLSLLNLVLNAVDAVENVVEVRAIRVRSWRENGQVCVSVQDSGEGFSSDAQDRLFTPFYTTKREGIGMGLAISRPIVEAHGGSLTASANIEGGAMFQMQLPA